MKEYQATNFFTIVSNNLQSYTEEAERIGRSLYTLYKDVQDRDFAITLQTSDREITNIPNFYPTYIFKEALIKYQNFSIFSCKMLILRDF